MYNIQKLLELANAEDGYVEKRKNCPTTALYEKTGAYVGSDNWTKYWKDMADLGLPNYQGSYYCIVAIFALMTYAYGLEAAQKLCHQKFMINCQSTYAIFKANNAVYSEPKVGDICVFWNGNRFSHAELVISVSGDVVKMFGANTTATTTTIERNGGGCRYGKTYSLTALKKAGHKFCRPDYGTQFDEMWIQCGSFWKYQLEDGSYFKDGWKYINGKYYYFRDSVMVTGWLYDNDQWYFLDSLNGDMKSGWQMIDGTWRYFGESGDLKYGWLQIGDNWYYLSDENGSMAVGLVEIKRMKYFFDPESGIMASRCWKEVDGQWYWFSSSGAAYMSQWIQSDDGKWYYLRTDGVMATDTYVKDNLTDVYYPIMSDGTWNGATVTEAPSDKITH